MSWVDWFILGAAADIDRKQDKIIENQMLAQGKLEEVAKKKIESEKGTGMTYIFFALLFGLPGLALLAFVNPESDPGMTFMFGGIPTILGVIFLIVGIKRYSNAEKVGQQYLEVAKNRKSEIKRREIEEEERLRAEVRAQIEAEMKAKEKSRKK